MFDPNRSFKLLKSGAISQKLSPPVNRNQCAYGTSAFQHVAQFCHSGVDAGHRDMAS